MRLTVSQSNVPATPVAAAAPQGGLDDHIYQRLLKDRIIFLGSDVRDDNAITDARFEAYRTAIVAQGKNLMMVVANSLAYK